MSDPPPSSAAPPEMRCWQSAWTEGCEERYFDLCVEHDRCLVLAREAVAVRELVTDADAPFVVRAASNVFLGVVQDFYRAQEMLRRYEVRLARLGFSVDQETGSVWAEGLDVSCVQPAMLMPPMEERLNYPR